ncbi:MAG: DUF885 domain-containing protein [Steroidobacteraceae bacterium]|nr:DUF885 domain-containing protein [Steroidobacteraceae bacterium]
MILKRGLSPLIVILALALAGCGRGSAPESPGGAPVDARAAAKAAKAASAEAQRLRDVTEAYYDQYLQLNPLTATAEGDHRFDDRFGDYVSERWMADWLATEQEALEKLAAIDPAKLTGEDLVTYESFRYGRETAIAGFRYPSELLPVHQFGGLHTYFAVLGSGGGAHPFRTTQDYDNFLARMDGFVAWVDQSIVNMQAGATRGVVQPRVIVERLIPQLAALAVTDPKQSVFWQPLTQFPAAVKAADRDRLTKAYAEKLAKHVLPAYRRLHDFLKDEYLAQSRAGVAWSELGNGAEWYAYLVRYHTTTSLTPGEVHELGLREVARIRAEMEHVKSQLGHGGDLRSFFDALRADPALYSTDPAELLAGYQAIQARVEQAMPLLFARRPKAGFEIREVEAFRAASEAAGSYAPGSADGKRPGVFYVNTYDLASRPKYAMEALYLHEAVPGHHYQISIAQEAAEMPRYRRFAYDTAYGEGWALYAESLGRDLGLYTDGYSYFGSLSAEMWRAVRLVVDTGLHAKGWTREQAIDYFRANTALGDADIKAEVERYIAWPGQALAYKVGALKILELRRRAQEKLGPRFDVRAFHAQVVDSGSLPLAVLEKKIDRWIESQ